MKKYILFIFFIQGCILHGLGQSFIYHSDSPFGIMLLKEDSTRAAQTVTFYDYDGDGDQDLFLTGLDFIDDFDHWEGIHFFIEMQENIGNRYQPLFGNRKEIFEEFPFPTGYFMPGLGDLNHDGKVDFIVNAEIDEVGNGKALMMINQGTRDTIQFEITTLDSFGLSDFVPESVFIPHLIDLDGDGDLDLMNSGFNSAFAVEDGPNVPVFYYARNVGTNQIPDLQGWYPNPYGLVPDTIGEFLANGDIDNDGDIDFIGSMISIPADSINQLLVHLNTPGADSKPSFNGYLNSPFGLPTNHGESQFLFPALTDLDGDGDLDLFVFSGNQQDVALQYYVNNLCEVTTQEVALTVCEGESVMIGNESFSEAGDYTIHLQSSQGCDSIILLSLDVFLIPTTEVQASICEGDMYTIGNDVFTSSGNYVVFISASNGCDSIINLALSVLPVENVNVQASICEGDSYTIGDETFTLPGDFVVVLDAVNGCDSIVNLTLNVIPPIITSLQVSICEGDSFSIGNDTITFPGDYSFAFVSVNGCDSIVTLNLTILPPNMIDLQASICHGDFYTIGNETFSTAGDYTVILVAANGCDSIVNLSLTVNVVDDSVTQSNRILTAHQSGAIYQWLDCDSGEEIPGAVNQIYEATVTGHYAVRITIFECTVQSDCFSVTVLTGLADDMVSEAISIYPNPSKGTVYLKNNSPYSITSFSLTNLSGQVIGEFFLDGNNSTNLSSLAPGFYIVKFKVNGNDVIKRIIIM